MENCAYMQELISRMLDEELNENEQAALAKHLESCPECRAVYEAFSAVSASLRGELEEPPERLRENVMAEIRRGEIRRKNRFGWRGALTAAAVLALALGLRYGLTPRMNEMKLMSAAVQEIAAEDAESAPAEAMLFDAMESEASGESALDEAALYDAIESEESAESALTAGSAAKNAANSLPKPTAAPPAPTAESAPAADNAPRYAAAGSAAGKAAGETPELAELDLSRLRFAELLELLDGEPVDFSLEGLPISRSLSILCADNWLALFEYEGSWYYYVAADPAPRRSSLDLEALQAGAEFGVIAPSVLAFVR